MKVTLKFIQDNFRRFNTEIFGGEFPEIRLYVNSRGRALGIFGHPPRGEATIPSPLLLSKCSISLSGSFDLDERVWEDTLIHEMLHYAIWYKGWEDQSAHGPNFRRLMATVNRVHGRHLTISHKTPKGSLDSEHIREKRHLILISNFKNGDLGIMVVASTKVFEIEDSIHRAARAMNIVSWEWYFSNEPWFNKFPNSRTLKIYKLTSEERERYIAGAKALSMVEEDGKRSLILTSALERRKSKGSK